MSLGCLPTPRLALTALAIGWFAAVTGLADECPVTSVSDSPLYIDGKPIDGWFGSDWLAVRVPRDGRWIGMGPDHSYRDKLWWWRAGYDALDESPPNLTIVATKVDDPNVIFRVTTATNANNPFGFGDAMLTGMEFPSPGCWRIRGDYDQSRSLEFVVEVGARDGP